MQIKSINANGPVPQQLTSLHEDLRLLNQTINNGGVDAGLFGGQPPSFYAPALHGVNVFHVPMALSDTRWVDSGITVDPDNGDITIPGYVRDIVTITDNVDGGSAEAVYLVKQVLEGGAANAVYLRDQILNGGSA